MYRRSSCSGVRVLRSHKRGKYSRLEFKEAEAPPRIKRQMCDKTQYGRQKRQ